MKERNFTSVSLIFHILICLAFPQTLRSQVVSVGSGSYTTILPPADAAGRNQFPAGKPRVSGLAATKPIATSDW